MKKYLTILFFSLQVCNVYAQGQKHNAVWYFGRNFGLDFNTPEPTVLKNSALGYSQLTFPSGETWVCGIVAARQFPTLWAIY